MHYKNYTLVFYRSMAPSHNKLTCFPYIFKQLNLYLLKIPELRFQTRNYDFSYLALFSAQSQFLTHASQIQRMKWGADKAEAKLEPQMKCKCHDDIVDDESVYVNHATSCAVMPLLGAVCCATDSALLNSNMWGSGSCTI